MGSGGQAIYIPTDHVAGSPGFGRKACSVVLVLADDITLLCRSGTCRPFWESITALHYWARLYSYYLVRLAIYIYAVAATELRWLAVTSWYGGDWVLTASVGDCVQHTVVCALEQILAGHLMIPVSADMACCALLGTCLVNSIWLILLHWVWAAPNTPAVFPCMSTDVRAAWDQYFGLRLMLCLRLLLAWAVGDPTFIWCV